MGRRVRDLQEAGFSNTQIARHCGCHHERIRELVENPNCEPRYTTGEALIKLHENVVFYGLSQWGRMILALRIHGFSFEQIARRVGANTAYIQHVIGKDPAVIPNHALGEGLIRMYQTHVRRFV